MTLFPFKINNLPLRPKSVEILLRRGFVTISEIESSKGNGGISNFAAELGCSLSEASSISREVEMAVISLTSRNPKFSIESKEKSNKSGDSILNPYVNLNKNRDDTINVNSTNSNDNKVMSGGVTAAKILMQQRIRLNRPIVTFCKSIDNLLGGGFATSEVTEVVGVPGVGKTQLAMQLCVDASLPKPYGGVDGESVYIDSEGSFAPERCYTMAASLVEHVHSSARRRMQRSRNEFSHSQNIDTSEEVLDVYKTESILSGIHVFRVYDEASQSATIKSLYSFISKRRNHRKPVRAVVIDSIAFHYRSTYAKNDFAGRTRSLASIAATLSDIATKFEVAVIVINHMTTKVRKNTDSTNLQSNQASLAKPNATAENGSKLIPALGESWAHSITSRLLLTHDDCMQRNSNKLLPFSRRRCTLVKSPHKPAGIAHYCILEVGVRDLPGIDLSNPIMNQSNDNRNETSRPSQAPALSNFTKRRRFV